MLKRSFSNGSRCWIAAFAVVVFIRSFGILYLFQYQPPAEGFSKDQEYKKIRFYKRDVAPEPAHIPQSVERHEIEHDVLMPKELFLLNPVEISTLLRSPPFIA